MGQKVDLHIHSWFSDGSISPTSIVKQAKACGREKIAITDHDGVDGVKEALEAGKEAEIEVVPGIEFSTETEDGIELHILGYHIDIENAEFKTVLENLRKKRQKRNEKLLTVLAELGYPLTMEDLTLRKGQNFIGKPIIARAMVKKGYIQNPKEAFAEGKFLESPQAKAVKKEKLKTSEAIQLIRKTGGMAVLAHPIQIKKFGVPGSEEFYEKTEHLISKLKGEGLAGLECFHPDHSEEQAGRFVNLAKKYDLAITRGSDFHGSRYE